MCSCCQYADVACGSISAASAIAAAATTAATVANVAAISTKGEDVNSGEVVGCGVKFDFVVVQR